MADDTDVVRAVRIKRSVYDDIVAWAQSQGAQPSLAEAIRYTLERGIAAIKSDAQPRKSSR